MKVTSILENREPEEYVLLGMNYDKELKYACKIQLNMINRGG